MLITYYLNLFISLPLYRKSQYYSFDNLTTPRIRVSFRESTNHCFRQRCQIILLKADSRNSKNVSSITGLCSVSVNNWIIRYQSKGLTVFVTKPRRGRKAVLSIETDKSLILSAIKTNRQRMRTAKAEWKFLS